jgi:hypothetical protein
VSIREADTAGGQAFLAWRSMRTLAKICGWLVAVPLCVGCGGGSDAPPPQVDSEVLEVKKVPASSLPALGSYLPVLDEGRVEVAPPKGWTPKSRREDYLCAFGQERGASVPAIVVKVSPVAIDGFEDVAEENVADFAAALQAELDPKHLAEPARPMIIGDHAFARYVKKAAIENLPAEVQMLETVHAGRAYTIELRVRSKDLTKHRDAAYAVAAGIKFRQSTAEKAATAEAEQPPQAGDAPAPAPE